MRSVAQQASAPAFVIVERLTTTGPESIQEQYGKVSREIVGKFGGRYLARSQHNELLEGDTGPPCCMAIISFPSVEAARNWFDSPENQEAAKRALGCKIGEDVGYCLKSQICNRHSTIPSVGA